MDFAIKAEAMSLGLSYGLNCLAFGLVSAGGGPIDLRIDPLGS